MTVVISINIISFDSLSQHFPIRRAKLPSLNQTIKTDIKMIPVLMCRIQIIWILYRNHSFLKNLYMREYARNRKSNRLCIYLFCNWLLHSKVSSSRTWSLCDVTVMENGTWILKARLLFEYKMVMQFQIVVVLNVCRQTLGQSYEQQQVDLAIRLIKNIH